MKVLVVGSNGQIGQRLIRLLKESSEHTVRAMVRKQEQADAYEKQGIETALADLEGSVDSIADAAKECDVIVFAAGSGGKTGDDKTLLIDLDGAGKAIEAAEQAGIDRFIMVSAIQANNRKNWHKNILPYYAAKHYADRVLESSSLNYTIIRPGILLNESGTGKVAAAENIVYGSIPRDDVALAIVKALSEKNTYRRTFDIISGNDPIDDALKKI
ncbi:sugar epimerase [Paenibacillus sp. IHB B 3415]|uniref:SDR family oxidoreductase n=1 Tax=Paenibacillus sp. IHB B 3415 TaxID=867080 RepID=UPI0005756F05|nr:SDR family oxidoreductase [Paenibacillus sp. IHB B 3415]KHL97069.1 sugar epimerase [Paenibacillus sp. IHB B 3415]